MFSAEKKKVEWKEQVAVHSAPLTPTSNTGPLLTGSCLHCQNVGLHEIVEGKGDSAKQKLRLCGRAGRIPDW